MTIATRSAEAPLLSARDLSKRFSLRHSWFDHSAGSISAVDGISFEIAAGQTLGLVGESGCGKSTTAKIILGLERPDGGEVTIEGQSYADPDKAMLRRLRGKVQMVFQDPYASLTPHFTIEAILREPLVVHGLCSRSELADRVTAVLQAVGLPSEIRRRYPHELSGGQRQRIGIARAIAVEPGLIVCDEPVSALDISIRSQIVNLLLDLQRERGVAYLFISHDLDLVEHVSDEVAVMYLGRIVERAPTRAFYANPMHPYSRALLASSPIANPRQRTRATPLVGDIGSSAFQATGCRFRSRCPVAFGDCAEIEPALREVASGHEVACHLATDTYSARPGVRSGGPAVP